VNGAGYNKEEMRPELIVAAWLQEMQNGIQA